ncbi:ABC transporter permease [Peribacillus sp. NPDC097284]|uniref:ABC transporter permease n=1 Tax=Peribacillus sp. NPDC097284 TaxID=3364401 RepID=UPI003806F7E9
MKSFLIAWKDFKIRAMDRRGFMTMLIMPLILTLILGMALKDIFGRDEGFQETSVGLYVDKKDPMADALKQDVLEKTEFLTLKTVDSEEKLKEMVKKEEVEVGILIPAEWGANLDEAVLYSNQDTQLKATVVESIVSSFTERVQTISKTSEAVMKNATQTQAVATGEGAGKETAERVSMELTESGKVDMEVGNQSVGETSISSMQYYAAAMLVMFLLFNVTLGAKSMIQERHTDTLARLNSAPMNQYSILIGKFLGTLYFAFIQLLLFYVATSLFFNVNWGESRGQVVAFGFMYSVAVAGLSMLLAAFIRKEKTADLISGIGIQLFAIVGGSMLPIYAFPERLKTIAALTPNNWALTGFLDIMSGVGWSGLLLPFSVLGLIGLVSMLIGAWRLRGRYA